MGKVYNFVNDGVAEAIEYINNSYQKGEIVGIVIGIKCKDDNFAILNSLTMNHLETVGLIECIKRKPSFTNNTD